MSLPTSGCSLSSWSVALKKSFISYSSLNGQIWVLESGILHLRLLWALDFMMTAGDLSPELTNGSLCLYLFSLMEPDRSQTLIEFRGLSVKVRSL